MTYGTIELQTKPRNEWVIQADAHVVMRLRRLFQGSVRSGGKDLKVRVSHSRSNCRDLCWVMERWPLTISEADEKLLRAYAGDYDQARDLMRSILSGKVRGEHFELAIPAREYQRVGAAAWLAARGLLLADSLGIGKTATAIAGLTDPRTRPALVVTPANLTRQWQREVAKFAPGLTTHILRKREPYDLREIGGALPDVIISSYSKLSGWTDHLTGVVRSVVMDECQELRKGTDTAKGTAVNQIGQAADFRLGLSATPIHNYGSEFYNVLDIIRPGELGTHSEFLNQWCWDNGRQAGLTDPVAFGTWLRDAGMMLRRTREEVGLELPPVTKVLQYVDTDRQPLADIASAASELAEIILSSQGRGRGEVLQASEQLSNILRQATGIAKAPHVADFVRMLLDSDESVVLYGWHREVYGIWMERLKDLNPLLYTGSEGVAAKDRAAQAFISGESRLLIMSLRSGAGLDGLQEAGSCVVFGELDWSWSVHEQCTARIDRPGQRVPVVAYYMVADGGSDPTVIDVLGIKRDQLVGVRDLTSNFIERMDNGGERIRILAEQYLKRRK